MSLQFKVPVLQLRTSPVPFKHAIQCVIFGFTKNSSPIFLQSGKSMADNAVSFRGATLDLGVQVEERQLLIGHVGNGVTAFELSMKLAKFVNR